jgi:predicted esterase
MNIMHRFNKSAVVVTLLGVAGLSGCVVPQPRGNGEMSYRKTPTGAAYYLYLPEDYVKTEGQRPPDKKFPLVVSFHGMRPWDSAGAQIVEWQQEADRYGYVVVAPDTRVSDLFGELPVRRVSKAVKADEQDALDILDEVTHKLDVDPHHVLSTSWSMGGYLAHYMVNRHPDRFSCLAVRQSNFSAEILDPARIPEYRDTHRVAIFWTKNDFAICQRESKQAIDWYTSRGFDTTHGIIDKLGHERTPETAAAFFASTCGAEPKSLPANLATRITVSSDGSGETGEQTALAPRSAAAGRPHSAGSARPERFTDVAGRDQPVQDAQPAADGKWRETSATLASRPVRSVDAGMDAAPGEGGFSRPTAVKTLPSSGPSGAAAGRDEAAEDKSSQPLQATVRLSAYIGISPMRVSYTVQLPPDVLEGARVVWTDNGEPISEGVSGQRSLVTAGQHRLEVRVVARDAREFLGSKTVTVLDRLTIDDESD